MKTALITLVLVFTQLVFLQAENINNQSVQNISQDQSTTKYQYLFSKYLGKNVEVITVDNVKTKGKLREVGEDYIKIEKGKKILRFERHNISKLSLSKFNINKLKHFFILGSITLVSVYVGGGLLSD